VRASAGAILARVLVQNTSFFAQWISQPSLHLVLGQMSSESSKSLLLTFFDAWLEKVHSYTLMGFLLNVGQINHNFFSLSLCRQIPLPHIHGKKSVLWRYVSY
jgi:hypothetical protein